MGGPNVTTNTYAVEQANAKVQNMTNKEPRKRKVLQRARSTKHTGSKRPLMLQKITNRKRNRRARATRQAQRRQRKGK